MHPTPHPTSLALGHLPLEGKSLACCGQHVFNEDAVAHGRVVHQHMGHSAHQFAVLNDGTAGHADVKCGTKEFCIFLRFYAHFGVKGRFLHTSSAILKLT